MSSSQREAPREARGGRRIERIWVMAALQVVLLLAADVLFWFSAEFRGFSPPREGSLGERLYYAALVACGPLSGAGFGLLAVLVVLGLVAAVLLGLRFPRSVPVQLLLMAAIATWFLFGLVAGGLRIT